MSREMPNFLVFVRRKRTIRQPAGVYRVYDLRYFVGFNCAIDRRTKGGDIFDFLGGQDVDISSALRPIAFSFGTQQY